MTYLDVQQLSLKQGKRFLCQSLSLRFAASEIWGILGVNGVGKSTLLHTLAGLRAPYAGKIYLSHKPLAELSRQQIAKHIGILFQENPLATQHTVWDICQTSRFPHRAYYAKHDDPHDENMIATALQATSLTAFKHRTVSALSGGERRRLAIAAVLAQTPQYYLLDEPTNHLDLRHQTQILHYLRSLAHTQQRTLIMSLHDVNLAQQYCTHVLLMFEDGHVALGPKNTLLTHEHLSALYQQPLIPLTVAGHVYWQVKSDITNSM